MAGITLSPLAAMKMAIEQAKQGAGFVAPNPMVGCVIVDSSGRFLSSGFHQKFGGPHAEVNALSAIADKNRLKDATVFVTLEPCSHYGKTPPCAELLASLPISKVVFGLLDPNPLVSGRGIDFLQRAKINTESLPELAGELEDLAEVFLTNQRERRAFIAVKVATTADGQFADKSQTRQWISGEQAGEQVQKLRGFYDAVLIGRKTFEIDNPRLNSREPAFLDKMNKVIVFDPQGKGLAALPNSDLLNSRRPESVIWCTSKEIETPQGVVNWVLPLVEGQLDWSRLSSLAYQAGICSVLVEGGGKTIGTALQQRAVDRWYQIISPSLVGQKNGLGVTGDWASDGLNKKIKLLRPTWNTLGSDVLLSGRVQW